MEEKKPPTHPPGQQPPGGQKPYATYENNFGDDGDNFYENPGYDQDMEVAVTVETSATREQNDPRQTVRVTMNGTKYDLLDRQWPGGNPPPKTYPFRWQFPEPGKARFPLPKKSPFRIEFHHGTEQAKNGDFKLKVDFYRV